ncbi:hypothetical protein FA048_15850 [Pedobacter polaris]|uniref:RadC-like JAB domain-containing protein n=1 Tax=Pedobacter polaris TaxID=2571273 RepID=A0A4U1CIH9_9SPHI|nr:hypothetical protein FA048_15850 [Pedobacter polaris]
MRVGKSPTDLFLCKQQIVGLAIACNATNVVLAQCRDSKKTRFDSFDRLLVVSLFAACEKAEVNIIDYLLCHAGSYYSFINEELLN